MAGARRGTSIGAALGIMLIGLVVVLGALRIYTAYIQSHTALEEYAQSIQKPVLVLRGLEFPSASTVRVTLANQGPSELVVRRVGIYRYSPDGVPGEVTWSPLGNVTLPVGGEATFPFTVDRIYWYIGLGRPLRVVVATDRGVYLLGYAPENSTFTLRIGLPAWARNETLRGNLTSLFLEARVPGGQVSARISFRDLFQGDCTAPVQKIVPPVVLRACYSPQGNAVTATVQGPPGARVEISIQGTTTGYPGVFQRLGERRAPTGFYTDRSYSPKVVFNVTLRPGQDRVVPVSLPELLYQSHRYEGQEPRMRILDFTRLIMPEIVDTGAASSGNAGSPGNLYYGVGEYMLAETRGHPETLARKILTVAGQLMSALNITATSPADWAV